MDRLDVLRALVNKFDSKRYLEIGVSRGKCFLRIRARSKVAVDPSIKISRRKMMRFLSTNLHSKFHQETSDQFFQRAADGQIFDVIFIDGLHAYRQALRDIENALAVLSSNGVIVVHDCNPPTEVAAHSGNSYEEVASLKLPNWNGEWCGDVWKSICYLRSTRRDLHAFVLDCDYGLGIIRRGQNGSVLEISGDAVDRMSYEDLVANRHTLLNLRPESYFKEFLGGFDVQTSNRR